MNVCVVTESHCQPFERSSTSKTRQENNKNVYNMSRVLSSMFIPVALCYDYIS